MTSVTVGQTDIGKPTTIGGPTTITGRMIPTKEPTAITGEPTSFTGELTATAQPSQWHHCHESVDIIYPNCAIPSHSVIQRSCQNTFLSTLRLCSYLYSTRSASLSSPSLNIKFPSYLLVNASMKKVPSLVLRITGYHFESKIYTMEARLP